MRYTNGYSPKELSKKAQSCLTRFLAKNGNPLQSRASYALLASRLRDSWRIHAPGPPIRSGRRFGSMPLPIRSETRMGDGSNQSANRRDAQSWLI